MARMLDAGIPVPRKALRNGKHRVAVKIWEALDYGPPLAPKIDPRIRRWARSGCLEGEWEEAMAEIRANWRAIKADLRDGEGFC